MEDRTPGDTLIVFVIGPTGSGKTTALDKVLSNILIGFNTSANPGKIPAAKQLAIRN